MKDIGMEIIDIPSPETFFFVWRRDFKPLKIPRYNTLGACDMCITLKSNTRKYIRSTIEHSLARQKMRKHLVQVRDEHKKQTLRDQSAAINPEISWTITTDFMQDFMMPWITKRPKSWYDISFYLTEF